MNANGRELILSEEGRHEAPLSVLLAFMSVHSRLTARSLPFPRRPTSSFAKSPQVIHFHHRHAGRVTCSAQDSRVTASADGGENGGLQIVGGRDGGVLNLRLL